MKKRFTAILLCSMISCSIVLGGCTSTSTPTEGSTQTATEENAVDSTVISESGSTESSDATTDNDVEQEVSNDYQYLTVNADGTRTFEDMAGRSVTIPARVEVALQVWPGCTPTINLLGAGGYFPAYMDGMKAETYYWSQQCNPYILQNPALDSSVEGILSYSPDVVFVKTKEDAETYANAGIAAAVMHASNSEKGLRAIRIMAEIFGEDAMKRCDAYMDYYNQTLSTIQERVETLDQTEWPSVFYVNTQGGDNPLVTSAKGTVQESYSNIVGAQVPAVEFAEGDRKEITAEQLLNMQPDYIIIFGTNSYAAYDNLINDPVLSQLDAVSSNQVLIAPRGNQPMSGTGVENILFLQWMSTQLHSELFPDFDMHAIVKAFYTNFMNYAISDNDVDVMLAGKNNPNE